MIVAARPDALVDDCYRCGYDLRGINDAQPCPECGLLAERSRRVTDELHQTRPRWLGSLAWGVKLLLLALGTNLLWILTLPVLVQWLIRHVVMASPPAFYFLLPWLGPDAAAVMLFSGVVLLTAAEGYPAADRADVRFRRIVRRWAFAPIVGLTLFQVQTLQDRLYPSGGYYNGAWRPLEIVAAVLLTLGCVPLPLLVFLRLRGLAKRARSAHLAEHCMIVGSGASAAILCCVVGAVLLYRGDEWFGEYWTSRSVISLAIVLVMSTAAVLFVLWSLYLLIRFAIAFARAARQLRRQWARDDRARAGA